MPDSSSKFCKGSSAATLQQTTDNSSVLIEHRCHAKKIDMVYDENVASCQLQDLLINNPPAENPPAFSLSLNQIQRIQSLMSSAGEDISSHDESSVSSDGVDFLLHPHSWMITCLTTTLTWRRKNVC